MRWLGEDAPDVTDDGERDFESFAQLQIERAAYMADALKDKLREQGACNEQL